MKDYIHKEFPKSCSPNDFFGQVKRTVNGKPVSIEQINLIIDSIVNGLKFRNEDYLFDLGCGNGALSFLIFNLIKKYHGIDFSEYLIEIAKNNFEKPDFYFECAEASDFLRQSVNNPEYTKGLCYGAFSYFERDKAPEILLNTRQKFMNIERFYIGNIPDKNRADKFFFKDINYSKLIGNNQSSIGIWWTMDEFKALAEATGWNIEFLNMPKSFYAAHYRFDVILTRK